MAFNWIRSITLVVKLNGTFVLNDVMYIHTPHIYLYGRRDICSSYVSPAGAVATAKCARVFRRINRLRDPESLLLSRTPSRRPVTTPLRIRAREGAHTVCPAHGGPSGGRRRQYKKSRTICTGSNDVGAWRRRRRTKHSASVRKNCLVPEDVYPAINRMGGDISDVG